MHFIEQQSREQMMMLSYETMVSTDNPVRLIDLMCKKFIADNPWREEWKGKEQIGRKSYSPSIMLGLLVYGYFNGISSSRKIETETYRNLELLWLMEGLQPDHWTICEFRRNNKQLIKDLLKSFRRFLIDEEFASGEKLVFDGSKMKAYASREMLNSEGIRKKLENLDKSIAEFLSQIESNDSKDEELEIAHLEIKQLKEKITKLEKLKVKFEFTGKALDASNKKQIAPNDKDAILVKGRDGKFAGYNAQTGVESKGHFIMHNEITTDENDIHQLENCVDNVTEEINISPDEVLADKGYGNMEQILNLENTGTQCYIPLQTTSREKEEANGIRFSYDKMSDTYTCPQGKKLHLFSKSKKRGSTLFDRYRCNECDGCPIRDNCTKSKKGRTYKRNIGQEEIDQYKQKLTTKYSKERVAERKGIVEHPFGTIKWLMGKFNFLLTGKEKTQIEFDLYTTAYNIKRLINCGENTELMNRMMKYSWSMA